MPEGVQSATDLLLKRPREEENQEANSCTAMELNNGGGGAPEELPECISAVIPGWFSEISPMWPGKFSVKYCFPEVHLFICVDLWLFLYLYCWGVSRFVRFFELHVRVFVNFIVSSNCSVVRLFICGSSVLGVDETREATGFTKLKSYSVIWGYSSFTFPNFFLFSVYRIFEYCDLLGSFSI